MYSWFFKTQEIERERERGPVENMERNFVSEREGPPGPYYVIV